MAVVVTTVKFVDGAYLVVLVLIPILVAMMLFIRRQYDGQEQELARPRRPRPRGPAPRAARRRPGQRASTARSSRRSTSGGRSSRDVRAVYVTDDPDAAEALRERWERQLPGVPLVIVESPYRAVISPVLAYLDVLDQAWPPDKEAPITIVVLPEYVPATGGTGCCTTRPPSGSRPRSLGREHTVIADVPYRREH